ncbi:hypothetical protein CGGC5_v004317 [Colletotrichum fructicola Nara gc5]|uniref:Zn(2)-C6 fungal-type domain-containing protein n=1 Tax=Colletotrichum fructicola (strain Nara gc5) TaxID=1213859 RepID=A0A7J6JGL5_COLFN|nr:hypothetical protein CGGC5_v004317 [Colletotrichum fructicola Nara gc5]
MADLEQVAEEAGPRNRACDLCFSKKIKCDRDDPCANCVAASAPCLRRRPRRRVKNTAEPIQRRFQTAAYLPNWRRSQSPRAPSITSNPATASARLQTAPEPTRDLSTEPQSQKTPVSQHGRQSTSSSSTERGPATVQAQHHIQTELQSRAGLDESKRQVLESALAFATNNTLPALAIDPEGYASEPTDLSDESPRKEAGLCFILDMGSVISPKTFEKQGLDLIEKKVSGATYLHYTVNVNFLAWIYLGATNSEPGTLMHAHLLTRQQQYEKNILIALHRIGVLDPPSMSLFQALLSGTMYMLLSGKLEKCWQLSTAACRTCMALGGPQLISSPSDKFGSEEARYGLSLCYMFDKALALSMNRTACLPDMNLDTTDLLGPDPAKPHTYLLHVYLRLAEIQNEIVHGSRERSNSKDMLSRVQCMQQEMWKIKETIREFRNTQLQSKDSYLRGEWMGVDFAYHSVMTSVVKLHPYLAEDVGLHQQLLGFARTSLSSLNDMLLHAKTLTDIHNFRVSVSWLVLFYPLYPFFVLFTHAVSVSSVQDYQLLANVTNGLREFSGQNSALMGVQKLFEGFMALYIKRRTGGNTVHSKRG